MYEKKIGITNFYEIFFVCNIKKKKTDGKLNNIISYSQKKN